MKTSLLTVIAMAMALSLTAPAMAAGGIEYPSGHGALQRWDLEGIALTPAWVKAWLGFLGVAFLSGLLFVGRHVTARWTLILFALSFFVTPVVFRLLGLPFLAGSIAIGHLVFWTIPLALLLRERAFLDAQYSRNYRLWSAAVTFAIVVSFIFDVGLAVSYVAHFAGQ